MPYELPLPKGLAGWQVKIHDDERLEKPHITIYLNSRKWRYSLRDKSFLDHGERWNQVDSAVKRAIESEANWNQLIEQWNKIHPDNPV